jgi:predicted DNA-binding transcriptional regulator AlpA
MSRIPPDDDGRVAKLAARRSGLVQSGFPVLVRFNDLVAAGIVQNRTTLLRLIDGGNFPPGMLIGRNTRAWRLDELEAWLASRPSARKAVPPGVGRPRVRDKRRAAAGAQAL